MAYSSTDIASLTGGFGQQVMLQQQQAAMITNQFGGYSPSARSFPVATQGEQFGGMLMNGMGQMGMSALGSQRLNSMGGGIGAPAAQSGQFLLGQMSYGAQQQQMLDVNLRDSYRHPNAFGGRGFSGSETSQIGSSLRQMSHMRGPSGETTSFEELGQLAANMGRMGMAEGVRSAKDFNEKFKTMLSTVKTIATELGTSLEEAQKVMASMKGSGIFRNQGQFASMIRQGALAGNMSQGEMSAAGQMGAQISRSIGGRGRAGAAAGINTLTNVGAATQAGVLSEEDIYNTTGLTGAEGRQAMAQNMMSGDARFFSGQLGRRVLASIAGKGGSINNEDVMAYMAGGVSTQETMRMAKKNLGKIGRADFIRNEGRLRGEAMNAFGGMGKAIAARNWMEERGMNMNEMDDRSMLFFQRKFNVGRDEADNLIKMARNMDTILGQRQRSNENDQYMKRMDQQDRASSPEEIVKRLEMARNKVNDGLREIGASFQKSMSTSIGEFIASMSNQYVQRRRGAMADIVSSLHRGGFGSKDILERQLGISLDEKGKASVMTGDLSSGGTRQQLFGSGKLSDEQFNRFLGGNAQKFREAGYDITKAKSMEDVYAIQRQSYKDGKGVEFNGPGRGSLYATLEKENEAIGASILGNRSRYGKSGASSITQTLGDIGTDASLLMGGSASKLGRGIAGASSWIGEQTQGIDNFINKYTADTKEAAAAREGLANKLTLGMGHTAVGGWMKDQVKSVLGEKSSVESQGVAEFLKGDEGRSLAGGIVGRSSADTLSATNMAAEQRRSLASQQTRTPEEEARMQGLSAMEAMGRLTLKARSVGGLSKMSKQELAEIARKTGFGDDVDRMLKAAQTVEATTQEERARDRGQAWEGRGMNARQEMEANKESDAELQADIDSGKIKIGEGAKAYLKTLKEIRQTESEFTGETSGEGGAANLKREESIQAKQEQLRVARRSGSIQERRKMAKELMSGGQGVEGARMMAEVKVEEQLERGRKKGAGGYEEAVAGILGADFEKGEFKGLNAEASTRAMLEKLGLGKDSTVAGKDRIAGELRSVMSSDSKMTPAERAQRLNELRGSKEVQEAQVKAQDAKSNANDPSYRKLGEIKDAIGTMASSLNKPLTASSGSLNQLVQHFVKE